MKSTFIIIRYLDSIKSFIFRHPKHVLPIILFVLLILLTSLAISGTSEGIYHKLLYGEKSQDPSLIYGQPRLIRSDEFLVTTQLTTIQSENGYPQFNPTQGEGKNVSVVLDVPYKDWSAIFKPQNFSFFILPLENAFAFKWWSILFTLLLAAYYFFLRILGDRKILLSILGASLITFSPFVFWWYQSGTILSIAYGFILLLISMSLIDEVRLSKKKVSSLSIKTFTKSAAMAYILICFALILYPPFQIPIALIVLFILIGYTLERLNKNIKNLRVLLRLALPFILVTLVSVSICAAFIGSRYDTFKAITETTYPGKREIQSGKDHSLKALLVPYLQPQFQRESKGTQYYLNQSESSMFIVSSLILIIPSIAGLAWVYISSRKIDWILASLTSINTLFLAHIFIPLPSFFTKLFLLHLVPQQRLLLGIGLAGTITLVYMSVLLRSKATKHRFVKYFAYGYTGLLFAAGLWAGVEIINKYPNFISNIYLVIALNTIVCIGILLFLLRKVTLGIGILAAFSILSSIYINPLYKGLGDLNPKSSIASAIREVSPKDSKWGVVDGTYYNNLPQIAGRQSISGIEFYPNKKFWEKYVGKENEPYYNRYAHIILSDSTQSIELVQSDLIKISIRCDKKILNTIDYLLTTKPLSNNCTSLIKKVEYPNTNYFIYKINH